MTQLATPPVRKSAPVPAGDRGRGGVRAWPGRWRLALRLARRDARRAKGRTTLVLLMVGLPVLLIVAADTLYRSNDLSPIEALPAELGAADARIDGLSRRPVYADPQTGDAIAFAEPADPAWTAAEVRALLPAGTDVVERQIGTVLYRTGIGYAQVDAYADDLTDPVRAGAFEVLEGRAPTRPGEVAISPRLADRGIGVDDTVQLTGDDVVATVVGVVRSDSAGSGTYVVLPPEDAALLADPAPQFFVRVPGGLDWPAVRDLNGEGLVVLSRAVPLDPPPASEYLPPEYPPDPGLSTEALAVIALVVAALLLEVVLLAGPAFAVGLRRQRRDLALIAACGGGPADLRRVVLASGLLLGAGAAVAGALLGVAAARVAIPVLESRWGATFGPFDVPLLDVLAVLAAGALAGLAAAAVPARQAARTDVVTALTGRRAPVRRSWRPPVVGFVVAAAGVALTVLGAQGAELAVAGGAVLLVVGLVIATPWLVGLLAPLARRLPTAGRLAVRDATRNRTRTAPAVAAVLATVAGVTALAIGSGSDSAQARRDYVPQLSMGAASVGLFGSDPEAWQAAERVTAEQVPGREVHRLDGVAFGDTEDPRFVQVIQPGCTGSAESCSWFPDTWRFQPMFDVVVTDPEGLAATVPTEVRDQAVAALEEGRAVVFGQAPLTPSGEVELGAFRIQAGDQQLVETVGLPATRVAAPPGRRWLAVPAVVVVPRALADLLPAEVGPARLVVGGPDAPVTEQEQTALSEAITAVTPDSFVYVERGWSDDQRLARLLLMLVGGALVLVATLTATGLAMADARPDLATLAAVGAAPTTRRRMAMAAAAVIGGTGAVLGVLAGLAPGIAIAYLLTSDDYGNGAQPLVVVPWEVLGIVGIGVPLLAVAVTGLAVRSRLPMAARIAP